MLADGERSARPPARGPPPSCAPPRPGLGEGCWTPPRYDVSKELAGLEFAGSSGSGIPGRQQLLVGGVIGKQGVGTANPLQVVLVDAGVERTRHDVVSDAGHVAVQLNEITDNPPCALLVLFQIGGLTRGTNPRPELRHAASS